LDYKISMPLFDRLKDVVRSEITHLRNPESRQEAREAKRAAKEAEKEFAKDAKDARNKSTVEATMPRRAPAVVDVEGALRVLELSGSPSIDDVRRQYRALAHRYHPKTRSSVPDEVNAARVVLDALTDALELLEEHLLPA
jgi:hypothetical protein